MRMGKEKKMSKEYIDREAAMKAIENDCLELVYYTKEDAIQCVKAIPAADVVEVVRCNNCAVPHNRWTGCPKLNGLITPPDFYCGCGERRKEDG